MCVLCVCLFVHCVQTHTRCRLCSPFQWFHIFLRVKGKAKMPRHLPYQSSRILILHKDVMCQHFPAFHVEDEAEAEEKLSSLNCESHEHSVRLRFKRAKRTAWKAEENRQQQQKWTNDHQSVRLIDINRQTSTQVSSWVLSKWQAANMRAVEHFN